MYSAEIYSVSEVEKIETRDGVYLRQVIVFI